MKIGIIVYSQTGNTLKVCEKLRAKLIDDGHSTAIEKVEIQKQDKSSAPIIISNAPDPSVYDAVIFASPVQAFSLARPMTQYMNKLTSLSGKKVACMLTKQLPFRWTGGNHALSQMSANVRNAGADVIATGMIIWSGKKLEDDIEETVRTISEYFQS